VNAAESRRHVERLRSGDADYLIELGRRNAARRDKIIARDRELWKDEPKGEVPKESTGERFIREYQAEQAKR
jgi:hypothetical protein